MWVVGGFCGPVPRSLLILTGLRVDVTLRTTGPATEESQRG